MPHLNLVTILSSAITKEQVTAIVNWVGDDQKRFNELFHVFTNSHYRIVQRAAWPLSYCVIRHPALIQSHYKELLQLLRDSNQPVAVRRNILRLLDQGPLIPKRYHGQLMDLCFTLLEDVNETIAAKAFCIGILAKLSVIYPEILPELKTICQILLTHAAPAVRNRALKVLGKQ